MLLADATALIQDKPFVVEACDRQADCDCLEMLAHWCYQFSPIVEIDWGEPPESLYFDLSGITHLYGGEAALAEHVRQAFHTQGYRVQIGIANTPSAAWAATHYLPGTINIVSPAAMDALLELPLEALRLPQQQWKKLDRLGIYRIEQLVQLPRQSLPSRIGPEVLKRLDCFTGDQVETISGHQFIPTFEQQWMLEQPIQHCETICHVVDVLLQRLANQLEAYGRGADRIKICFDCDDDQNINIDIGLYQPSASFERFNRLAQTHLETTRFVAGVKCVTVTVESTEGLEQRQCSLLATDNHADPRELADLFERLSSRLGENRVAKAAAVDDWQFENAFSFYPVTDRAYRSATIAADRFQQRRESDATRPVRMFFPPRPIRIIAFNDGVPARFNDHSTEHCIKRYWGPERLETAWWRGGSIKRDYYRVETASASRFWIFHCLTDGQWFIHGSFD
jgi:protein ImuB